MLCGDMAKDVCPHLIQPFLENFYKMSSNDRYRKLILAFDDIRRKGRSSPPAMALSLEREEEKQVRSHTSDAREYLECDYQVSPKSSSLQGNKIRPLQSLIVGKAMNAGLFE